MRILPLLCALLLILHGAAGFSLSRGTPEDCQRRGGFCSNGSCPLGIVRIGLCSLRDFCCRM
ncbi:Gallinacin-5 [Tinamus guttatus]|uniref:Gallinacin-5 n=1 Tax=Tinamus guttatus TaxID=94827 RepID=A0A099Z5G9_TINGU|nr:Gallinacin-5 [Tinamus guttatus]